jgi:hypothetical protein
MPPRSAYLEIGRDLVRVRMGIVFRTDLPRASLRGARLVRRRVSVGVHGWRGSWLVNGAQGPLVGFRVDPPDRARVYGVPVRLRELLVSVEDPDALIAELS